MVSDTIETKINTTPILLILIGSESKSLSNDMNNVPVVNINRDRIIPIFDFCVTSMIQTCNSIFSFFSIRFYLR